VKLWEGKKTFIFAVGGWNFKFSKVRNFQKWGLKKDYRAGLKVDWISDIISI
jgi:hypothetical protein